MSDLVRNPEDRFSHDMAHREMPRKDAECNANEPRHEKTNILVSDLVRHKPGCTATEDSQKLEISDLKSRGIVLST